MEECANFTDIGSHAVDETSVRYLADPRPESAASPMGASALIPIYRPHPR
ncbi:MAG: hypothetical protein IPO36_19235 [Anaerolineales bacterium]|nr:hypothetical protein [Anaerolineales bacterium]